MKTWQGLGYYSRARNMHESAKIVAKDYHSRFPVSYDELRKLKGIGDYSASAISSIAGGERQPVIDGNVLRVIARYQGIEEPVNTTAGRKKVKDFLFSQIDPAEPGTFNQAMMELGALVCKPRQPVCPECPVRAGCIALRDGKTAILPVLNKAKPSRTRYFHYLVITGGTGDERFTWLNKRAGKDIWKNLYDFPMIEAETQLGISELEMTGQWKLIFSGTGYTILPDISTDHHILSHQELNVIYLQVLSDLGDSSSFKKIPIKDVHKYPVSRLIEKYFKKIGW
jgi:A/G-specific adenine glycosylase